MRVVVHACVSSFTVTIVTRGLIPIRDLNTCWMTISCPIHLPFDLRNETLMSVAASKFKSYEKLADAGGFFGSSVCFSCQKTHGFQG